MAQKHNEEPSNAPMTRLGKLQLEAQPRILRNTAFTADEFTADNPIMQLGEIGYETDTNQLKIGDGVTAWTDLPYVGGGDSSASLAQVDEMPTASADNVGNIVQYVGATDANYTNGYIYECTSAGEPAVYSWTQIDVQPTSDTKNHIEEPIEFKDENDLEKVLRITPKANKDCWVKLRFFLGMEREGNVIKDKLLFNTDLYLPYSMFTDDFFDSKGRAVFTGISDLTFVSCSPRCKVQDQDGCWVDMVITWVNTEYVPTTGYSEYVIVEVDYSEGVDSITQENSYEGNPILCQYSDGNPTELAAIYPDLFNYTNTAPIIQAVDSTGAFTWLRYPFANMYYDTTLRFLTPVSDLDTWTSQYISQVRELPPADGTDGLNYEQGDALFQLTGAGQNEVMGYFYKPKYNTDRNAVATQTVGSGLTNITVNQSVFGENLHELGLADSGEIEYIYRVSGRWTDSEGREMQGITYSGTPQVDDVIHVEFDIGHWDWEQVNVQPGLETITGYDPTKTQTLKNINGVFTWVDD